MFRCSPNLRFINHTNLKIIIFKIEKQVLEPKFLEVNFFGFPDFQKICLNLFDNRSSFHGKKLS